VTLTTVGAAGIIMGVSFVLLRPLVVLLPEDQRFTGLTPDQFQALNPRLFTWMGMVFRSWGAFAIGLGALMVFVATQAYRRGDTWAWWALLVAGTTTFGIFFVVNLLLGSDFRFVIGLLAVAFGWALWHGRPRMHRPD
jgi:hypothetical protein